MLQNLGDSLKGQRWLAYTVLGLLAVVFAAWGAYGVVNLDLTGGQYAAKVAGEKLSVEEVRETWLQQQTMWQQRLGGELNAEQQKALQNELLEGMVRNTLLTQRARELGYRVSDSQVHAALRQEPAFQVEGKYSADAAKARLAQAGISPAAYEADLRRGLQRAQLQGGIRASAFLTPQEAQRLHALENEQREVRYAVLPAKQFAGNAPIDEAAIKARYDSNQSAYMTPESARLQYAELRLDQVATQIQLTDTEIREQYEKNKAKYIEPEKRRAHHILIEVGKDDAAAQKEAQQVLADAKAGKDFAALAKAHSDDKGSAAQGGDLGWAERGYFDAAFADALFSMKPGEIRGPVKSQFGYHIIRLDEIRSGKTQSFEEARADIESQLRRDKAAERFGDLQEQLQTRLEQTGANFDAVVREFGMQMGEVQNFQRDSGGAPLGTSPELQEAVFSTPVLTEKRVGGPIILGEDRIVIVRALEHRKAQPKPLSEVRDAIVAQLKEERGKEIALRAAQTARERLAGGASFEEATRGLGVTVEPARYITRNESSVPAPVRDAAFAAPRPEPSKPFVRALPVDEGAAVLAVTRSRVPPVSPNDLQNAMWKRQTAERYGEALAAAYVEEARRIADVKKNPKAFE